MELFKSRPRVAYTNKAGDKVYPVVVDIKKGIKSTEDIQFVSSDVNTGILSVAFIQGNDNYNVTGADVVCSVMQPDASTLELPCEVVGENIVEVPLGINGTSQDGVYSFDFKVFKGENKVVGTPIMNYSVSLSIGNDMVIEEDDRLPVLTMLMTQVNELKEETSETINQANIATEASREATANAIESTNNANAVSERVSQETSEAISRVDNTIVELNNTVSEKVSELDNAKSDMTTTISNKVNEVETRFNALTSSQQQDAEVIDARDGETSLKARLDRDLYKDGISLSDRIEAIEGLKDSQNMKYETDKGYLVCKETKNGVIDDLKIEGKTLVNLVHSKKGVQHNLVDYNVLHCKEDTVYTVIFNVAFTGESCWCGFLNSDLNSWRGQVDRLPQGLNVVKIVTTEGVAPYFRVGASTTVDTVERLIILEGDHTQNPPSYFEGLMSVGQDVDKISVESCYNVADISTEGNTNFDVAHIKKGITYSMSSKRSKDFGYNLILKPISGGNQKVLVSGTYKDFTTFVSDVEGILHFNSYEGMDISEIMILPSLYTEDTMPKFKPYSPDKKQILFYNENGELEPIQELHEWDSIEKHSENKWYYHKRSGKVVLNGSEDWQLHQTYTNCLRFAIEINTCAKKVHAPISDKFIGLGSIDWNRDMEHIIGNVDGWIHISMLKTKLPTPDVEGFKQWLQANNVAVVYQLAQEEVYELAPLHLDSYANETLILCNSGAISPKMEFSITSHINNLVLSNTKRINALEEKVFSALKQVLAGDMYSLAELLYPEDFVEENPENEIMLLPFE